MSTSDNNKVKLHYSYRNDSIRLRFIPADCKISKNIYTEHAKYLMMDIEVLMFAIPQQSVSCLSKRHFVQPLYLHPQKMILGEFRITEKESN